MKINEKFFIAQKNADKSIYTNLITPDYNGTYVQTNENYRYLNRVLCICRKRQISNETKNTELIRVYKMMGFSETEILSRLFKGDAVRVKSEAARADKERVIKENLKNMINFFSEFHFTPSFRFVNAFALAKDKAKYTKNYFIVQDHPNANEVVEKLQSAEFKQICLGFNDLNPEPINSRLDLYYGEPGTGKTTKAMKIAEKCIVCSSDMLPTDLLQNFAFSDGKAEFQKSDLWIAMEEGKTIVLDEMNMLPFESLRFLQGITDGKSTFNYKGFTINIHKDFKIIGTMNLNVNGQCIPLPAPLADRCSVIEEFVLDANALYKALIA